MNLILSESVLALVNRKQRAIRLSDWFMNLWVGQHRPTEELEGWLRVRGYEIVPGLDHHAGWDVRPAQGEKVGLFA